MLKKHFDPKARGYHAIYRENEINHCPGCGRSQWHIGRHTAECAFCMTALPLEATMTRSVMEKPIFVNRQGHRMELAA